MIMGVLDGMKKICGQIGSFLMVSGVGWLIDFGVFYYLTDKIGFVVSKANVISTIPALTFVFITATRKVFLRNESGISLKLKYVIYFLYQMILILCVSRVGQIVYNYLEGIAFLESFVFLNLKLLAKIIITPITMICNFLVMKFLTERI